MSKYKSSSILNAIELENLLNRNLDVTATVFHEFGEINRIELMLPDGSTIELGLFDGTLEEGNFQSHFVAVLVEDI